MKATTVGLLSLVLFFGVGSARGQLWFPVCDPDAILTDECDGGNPLADGYIVSMYWDANENGPDEEDSLFPLCPGTPCANFNQWMMMGESLIGIPGAPCVVDPPLTADAPAGTRVYLRVQACDVGVVWTTEVGIVGPVPDTLEWTCAPCEPAVVEMFLPMCDEQVFTDECDGGEPLPDGTPVYIYWDENANGPDDADTLIPLQSDNITVNFNMVWINGDMNGVPGTFCIDPAGFQARTSVVPLRVYVYIPACDQNVEWTSSVIVLNPDSLFAGFEWTCAPCEPAVVEMFLPMCDEQVFTDECDGGEPLPDGTPVYIYWDENANGPDDADTLIPLQSDNITVNFNMVWINGDMNGVPGTFCIDPAGFQARTSVVPLRVYVYIPACDQNVEWTSSVIVLNPDSLFAGYEWTCDVCETVSADDRRPGAPHGFALHPNYPNPFNPATEIAFDLPHATQTTLKVFDVTGREVAVLVDGIRTSGAHNVTFDANALSSGVYFYRLKAGSFVETRKMILMK